MPLFKIQHLTRYSYTSAVRDSANQVILFPIQDKYQEVVKQELKISGDPFVDRYKDYYGNEVGSFTHSEPHDKLEIRSKVWVVTQTKSLPVDDMFVGEQWNDLERLRLMVPYIDFLNQEYFAGLPELKAIIEHEKTKDDTPYQIALKHCQYVYENFNYIQGVTSAETTLDEIWKLKAGVCQDFAHMLTAMLRIVNIPARYISGYICPNKNGMRGEGATHAWAEAYIPGYGWIGLDPTNNCVANETHVRLAVGRNFTDCSPVRGVYKGPSEHQLEVSVSVGYEDEDNDDDATAYEPVKPLITEQQSPASDARNSYQKHLEFIQQQQQQQQQ